ncbi:hypothetical protein ACFL43_05440 [Thermodesulfobacteriota bacterium]
MTTNAFNSIDLDEALRIAKLVGFDIEDRGLRAGCCAGPGGKYLCQDKRYVVTKLLTHLDAIQARGESLLEEVRVFQEEARKAVDAYRSIEERLGRIVDRQ